MRSAVIASLVLACCGPVSTREAFSQPPSLSAVVPAGGKRGSSVVVQCRGDFPWPVKVWAPGIDVRVLEEKGKLELSIPKDLAADRVWIRLFNNDGASAARPFLIGGLKEVDEVEPNDAAASAQPISSDNLQQPGAEVTINGVLQKRGDLDAFAIRLSAGQTLIAALDANTRLGSPIDAVLQLATTTGTVLAANHDAVGLDPRLVYTVPEDGTYLVRLFAFPSKPNTRISYHGGDDCLYRLTVTTGSFMTHASPLTVSWMNPRKVQPIGWNIPPDLRLRVHPLGGVRQIPYREHEGPGANEPSGSGPLGFVFAEGIAGAARVRLTSSPVYETGGKITESEPLEIAVPSVVQGHLSCRRRTEAFTIRLKKGQTVRISVQSNTWHLPLVPQVRLTDPNDGEVAHAGASGPARDAAIQHKAASDGDYQLTIRDRYGHGGPRYVYVLNVTLAEPNFELFLDTDALIVSPDKPAELPVSINRTNVAGNATGRITVRAVDLPPWITSTPVISQEKDETAKKVTLEFTTTGLSYAGPIRIRGIAEQPKGLERYAFTPLNLGARLDHLWLTAQPSTQVAPEPAPSAEKPTP